MALECTSMHPEHDYWVVALFDKIDGKGFVLHDRHIKYVHELQNLYYEFKGKELIINLD